MTYDGFCRLGGKRCRLIKPSPCRACRTSTLIRRVSDRAAQGRSVLNYRSTPTWFLNCARSATEGRCQESQHGSIPRDAESFFISAITIA